MKTDVNDSIPETGTPETPAPETPASVTPEEQAKQDQESEGAFAEGFTEARGEEPPAPTPKADTPPAEEPAPASETPPVPAAPDKPVTLFAGKTEAEVLEMFNKVQSTEQLVASEVRKIYSKFGELQQALKSIKPGQSTLKIKGALKRLGAEYPEIAQMLSEDLEEASTASQEPPPEPTGAPAVQPMPEDFDTRMNTAVDTAVAKVTEKMEMRLLTVLHNDWLTLTGEKEFDTFLKSLPGEKVAVQLKNGAVAQYPKEAKRYLESNDAVVAAECFTKYKGWKAAHQRSKKQNEERLEGAITPPSGGAPPPATLDDEAAFQDGFKNAISGAS
jgi:hypothetical protein